ncbi:MAG: hypothetical protein DMG14_29140 [Acidobacteria bacterium]|nr:MAG: hypothetical protein DMG14_29140 [Acidobacteriota bacterium]
MFIDEGRCRKEESMKKHFVAAVGLLFLILSTTTPAFSQISNATVSGIIEDSTHAVLPGVTVVATNTATGVMSTVVTNESGAYNLPGLLPGPYKITAELPGFQTKTYELTLGNAQTVRLNFAMKSRLPWTVCWQHQALPLVKYFPSRRCETYRSSATTCYRSSIPYPAPAWTITV